MIITRYPEATPLCMMKAPTTAGKLMKVFTKLGIPKEILMDRGFNFSLKLIKELCGVLKS